MFQVKFVRSTMLRMVIEGNTKSDMTKWLKDYYSDIERVGPISFYFNLTALFALFLEFSFLVCCVRVLYPHPSV